jgi:hypothetical protein
MNEFINLINYLPTPPSLLPQYSLPTSPQATYVHSFSVVGSTTQVVYVGHRIALQKPGTQLLIFLLSFPKSCC